MIDLHCHILPGVDDGPATLEDSIAMAQAASGDGTRSIVVTPHGVEWAYTGGEAETRQRVADLRSELAKRGIELDLYPGLEVYLTPDVVALYRAGRIFTLNASRYMLVEFPLQMVPPYTEQVLFELQLQRLVPVIAHPERNSDIAAKPEALRPLVDRGMLVQLTAGSLVGAFGTRTRETAALLLKRGMAHIIASDAHSASGRSPCLTKAVQRASELIGVEAARAMVTTNPAAILRNEDVAMPEPQPARRRSWFPFRRKF